MKKNNNKLQYQVIDSVEALEEVVRLLEKGFEWGRVQSDILVAEIPKINSEYGLYGVGVYDGESIKGAVLFIYQGSILVDSNAVNVVNLSSWYMDPDYRGIPTISIARFMLNVLQDCFITNYTANEHISKLLLKLKFRKMGLKRNSVLIHKSLSGLLGKGVHVSKIKPKNIKLASRYISGFQYNRNFRYYEVECGDEVVQLIGKVVHFKRSIFGIRFTLRAFSIVWTSDEEKLASLWNKVALKLMVYAGVMKLMCEFSCSNFQLQWHEKEHNYLIYGDVKVDSIRPLQSELNLFM